jgi:hypothetical protein
VVRAQGVGAEVGELQYAAAPQVGGGSGGVLGYGLHAQGVPMGPIGDSLPDLALVLPPVVSCCLPVTRTSAPRNLRWRAHAS